MLLAPDPELFAPDVEPGLVGPRRQDGAVGENAVFAGLSATERADDERERRAAVCGRQDDGYEVSVYVGSMVGQGDPGGITTRFGQPVASWDKAAGREWAPGESLRTCAFRRLTPLSDA